MFLIHFSSLTADFGLSKIIDDQVTMKTVCGTPGYCGEWITSTTLLLVLNGVVGVLGGAVAVVDRVLAVVDVVVAVLGGVVAVVDRIPAAVLLHDLCCCDVR